MILLWVGLSLIDEPGLSFQTKEVNNETIVRKPYQKNGICFSGRVIRLFNNIQY